MTNPLEKTYALFAAPANKKIIAELEQRGAKVFQFSPLEIEKTVLDEKSIDTVKKLDAFDWVIFPDVLTVEYFLQILEENEVALFEMDSTQVCAIGEAVADRLRFAQLHADVIPASVSAKDVFLALSDYIGKEELSGLRFLLVKEDLDKYAINEQLVENNAKVIELPVYRAAISRNDETAKLKILLKGGAIDEFIFSSPTDLIALKRYFDNEYISETFAEILISATDKIIWQALSEHDLKANFFQLK